MRQETNGLESALVDIVRDLVVANRTARRLFARYRRGALSFPEVQQLVGDTDESILFRLKERSHALFRGLRGDSEVAVRREALFDLAVGSLFHEAMKFRENFYQRSVYGPKVQELRDRGVGPEAAELFHEFEKILQASAVRLDEAIHEAETLLSQTTAHLRVLLGDHRENGLVARYLIRNSALLQEVFGRELEELLGEIYGSATVGYELAARSFLESGYFAEARECLEQAMQRAGETAQQRRLVAYAEGMSSYLARRYPESVEQLERWLEAGPTPEEARYATLAHAALARVPQLVEGEESRPLCDAAIRLAQRIQRLVPGSSETGASG